MSKHVAPIDMLGNPIFGVADPTGPQYAATKKYVDDLIAGRSMKDSVKAASTGNLSLSAAQTVDGIALVAGDRVLVKNQTTQADNGVYVVGTGPWARADDANTWLELNGAMIPVDQGTVNDNKVFLNTANMGGTLGTTALTFIEFGTINVYTAGAGLTLSGNQFSIGTAALTTAMIQDSAITTAKQADGSTTTIKIADANVTLAKLAANSVDGTKILNDAVTTSKIADFQITTPKLVDSSVTNAKIAGAAVDAAKIANDAVTTVKILNANVTQAKLANDSVGTAQIINANVTAAKLAVSAVDLTTTVVTGTLPISKGGTGATTPTAARISLSAIGAWSNLVSVSSLSAGTYSVPASSHLMTITSIQATMVLVPVSGDMIKVEPDITLQSAGGVILFTFSYASLTSLAPGGSVMFSLQGLNQ